ncbi:hypothetical protein KC349_g177 [Hortaea werneckii]|nr:hypothetical protein KC349_g177 [Hortaea werneckii]
MLTSAAQPTRSPMQMSNHLQYRLCNTGIQAAFCIYLKKIASPVKLLLRLASVALLHVPHLLQIYSQPVTLPHINSTQTSHHPLTRLVPQNYIPMCQPLYPILPEPLHTLLEQLRSTCSVVTLVSSPINAHATGGALLPPSFPAAGYIASEGSDAIVRSHRGISDLLRIRAKSSRLTSPHSRPSGSAGGGERLGTSKINAFEDGGCGAVDGAPELDGGEAGGGERVGGYWKVSKRMMMVMRQVVSPVYEGYQPWVFVAMMAVWFASGVCGIRGGGTDNVGRVGLIAVCPNTDEEPAHSSTLISSFSMDLPPPHSPHRLFAKCTATATAAAVIFLSARYS